MDELALRPCSRADVEQMYELAEAMEAVDRLGTAVTREDVASQFDMPGIDLAQCSWLLPDPGSPDRAAALVGVMPLPSTDRDIVHVSVDIRPEHRSPELERALYAFADAQAPRMRQDRSRPCSVHTGLRPHLTHRAPLLTDLGYRPVRWFVVLERSLAEPIAALPPVYGLRLRAVDPNVDAEALHLTIHEAFLDHWSPVDFTLDQARYMFSTPGLARSRFFLACTDDGTPAGACGARVKVERLERDDVLEGEVMVIGVRRPWRGRGLGRRLLVSALEWMRAEGMATVTLDVDADNPTGAFRLYQSVGFTERRRSVTYARDLTDGDA